MSKRSAMVLLQDMLEALERCLEYTHNHTFETFCLNNITVDAVLRCLEVLGEAANQMPENIRTTYPAIPWHQIRGLRNRIVHAYFDVNLERVWMTVQQSLPNLKPELRKIISDLTK